MNTIIFYCNQRGIPLSDAQKKATLPFKIANIYSFYQTSVGIMFYIRMDDEQGRQYFFHFYHNGKYTLLNGYDGGDLSRYGKGKRKQRVP